MPGLNAFAELGEGIKSTCPPFVLRLSISFGQVDLDALTHQIGYAPPLALGEFRKRAMLLGF
jgi:hypothetical protein